MLLYIIRHGDPIYDPDCLTEKGKLQAQAVCKRLATRHFDHIYASGMIRAQQTADPMTVLTGMQYGIEDWTSEKYAWDDLSAITKDGKRNWVFYTVPNTAFRREESLSAGDKWYELPEFEGTNVQAGFQRIIDASDEFLARHGYQREGTVYKATGHTDERIAVFCHGGFGMTWISHLLQIPPHLMWASFGIHHTGVTILQFQPDKNGYVAPRCLCFSDLSHLYAERLPMVLGDGVEI